MAKKNNIANKSFNDYLQEIASNIKVIYGTLAIIMGLIITVVAFVMKVNSQEYRVHSLEESNTTLVKQVSVLEGGYGLVSKALQIVVSNSPENLQYEIKKINDLIKRHHGENNNTSPQPDSTFTNRTPGG